MWWWYVRRPFSNPAVSTSGWICLKSNETCQPTRNKTLVTFNGKLPSARDRCIMTWEMFLALILTSETTAYQLRSDDRKEGVVAKLLVFFEACRSAVRNSVVCCLPPQVLKHFWVAPLLDSRGLQDVEIWVIVQALQQFCEQLWRHNVILQQCGRFKTPNRRHTPPRKNIGIFWKSTFCSTRWANFRIFFKNQLWAIFQRLPIFVFGRIFI